MHTVKVQCKRRRGEAAKHDLSVGRVGEEGIGEPRKENTKSGENERPSAKMCQCRLNQSSEIRLADVN